MEGSTQLYGGDGNDTLYGYGGGNSEYEGNDGWDVTCDMLGSTCTEETATTRWTEVRRHDDTL